VFVSFIPLLPLYKKKPQLRKSELDKKTMLFETTCIEKRNPTGCFQSHSGMEEASVHKSNPKIYSTVRPLQRAGGQCQTPALWSRTKLTKNYTSAAERKKRRYFKNTMFCVDFTKKYYFTVTVFGSNNEKMQVNRQLVNL
jgi:hypothetical protein